MRVISIDLTIYMQNLSNVWKERINWVPQQLLLGKLMLDVLVWPNKLPDPDLGVERRAAPIRACYVSWLHQNSENSSIVNHRVLVHSIFFSKFHGKVLLPFPNIFTSWLTSFSCLAVYIEAMHYFNTEKRRLNEPWSVPVITEWLAV